MSDHGLTQPVIIIVSGPFSNVRISRSERIHGKKKDRNVYLERCSVLQKTKAKSSAKLLAYFASIKTQFFIIAFKIKNCSAIYFQNVSNIDCGPSFMEQI